MKRILLSVISLLLVVSMLSSCSGRKILRTKEITDVISSTNVVLYDFVSENEISPNYVCDSQAERNLKNAK